MKYIHLTGDMIKQVFDEAYALALKTRVTPTSVSLSALNGSQKLSDEEKAIIRMSVEAKKKVLALVDRCDKEVAWHGLVERDPDNPKIFNITDILVFPQEVTGATVTTDEKEYTAWLYNMNDDGGVSDEDFDKLRCHGHSHVRMGTSPSGVDITYQNNIMNNVTDFYIFMIHNKSGSVWANIYDVENNILYEDSDIIVEGCIDEVQEWASEEIKKKVKEKTYQYPQTATNYPTYQRPVQNYYGEYYDDGNYFAPETSKPAGKSKSTGTTKKKTTDKELENENWEKLLEELSADSVE